MEMQDRTNVQIFYKSGDVIITYVRNKQKLSWLNPVQSFYLAHSLRQKL